MASGLATNAGLLGTSTSSGSSSSNSWGPRDLYPSRRKGWSPTITGTSTFVGTELMTTKRRALTVKMSGKVLKSDRLENPSLIPHEGHVSSTTSSEVKLSRHSFKVTCWYSETLSGSAASEWEFCAIFSIGTGTEILSCSSTL